jgi:hypothetical protein
VSLAVWLFALVFLTLPSLALASTPQMPDLFRPEDSLSVLAVGLVGLAFLAALFRFLLRIAGGSRKDES